MRKIIEKLKKYWSEVSKNIPTTTLTYKQSYRVASPEKDKYGYYNVVVQLIGKSSIFRIKPEEILADISRSYAFL